MNILYHACCLSPKKWEVVVDPPDDVPEPDAVPEPDVVPDEDDVPEEVDEVEEELEEGA